MAKAKNKKQVSSDKVYGKKQQKLQKKSLNPFEVHINKEKVKVLGRQSKVNKGFPGVARAKAITKRKKTLLQEYSVKDKSNRFIDRRIGEKDFGLTEDDRNLARFTAERVKVHKKTSIFNLGDDEVLTHKGQTLSEIEKFEDPRSDDEELDGGNLENDFVEEAHFGGGVLKNTREEGVKTHRELIDQLIAESKKRKAEQQRIKESTIELTEKLDSEWRDLLPLVNKSKGKEGESKQKVDDYDKVMRELKFEARGTPSDRLKSEDEIAKEEKERLEKLEAERLQRMQGNLPQVKTVNHRSADDLDDDIVYDSDQENFLSYNEKGEANVEVNAELNGTNVRSLRNSEDSEQEESDEEEETEASDAGDSENEEEEEEEGNLAVSGNTNKNEDDNEDGSDESEDNLSDLKVQSEDESEPEESEDKRKQKIREDLLMRQEMMEKARNELPFTFPLPESYEDLKTTLLKHSAYQQGIIIERMIKCNHPSLGEKNKEGLSLLFIYLLQYISDVSLEAESIETCFDVAKNIFPQMYDLLQLNKENSSVVEAVKEVIVEKEGEFRKKPRRYPDLSVLMFLKLVGCLYPTSDYRHEISTPCFIFMEEMLRSCKIRSKRDIAFGLFIATLVLEYTALSHRYLPASINFLTGLFHLSIPKQLKNSTFKLLLPFDSKSPTLSLTADCSKMQISNKLESSDLIDGQISIEFKIRCTFVVSKLFGAFFENLKDLPSNIEIFEQGFKCLKLLPKELYPEEFRKSFEDLIADFDARVATRKLEYLVHQQKRPKALRLYEPKIEAVYDRKKHKVQSKAKTERDKLLYKIKKEKKGALREIRRDTAFLSRVKLDERIKSDLERREKVKRIFSEAASQQCELNAMERKKKRKK